jgi:DNA helicase-2/ATP-dependent DNA helicase PcrA
LTPSKDFLEGLNPRQREAVEHVEGPLLILAGAGSGKTRVITHRMAHLMSAHKVPGWAILAVTFTNKAAGEMRDRVRSLVSCAPSDAPLVATFHSFCVRLLRRDGAALGQVRRGFTPLFTIYDDDDQLAVVKQVYRSLGIDEETMKYRAALSRISHAKSHKQTPDDLARAATDPVSERLAVIYERYESQLLEANALDFDDLLLESVRLLANDEPTREKMRRRYEFLMVDEYQDTNRAQYELMRLLSGEQKNVCVVGDEDQSIYGWRGANIRNILDFERDFPGAVVIRLEQNYRSTKTILDAASSVVANNTERMGKTLWTDSGAGESILLYEAPDSENEALWIADTIENAIARDGRTRVAVLYRTNSQSRQIEEALRRYRRPYIVVGGFSFYQRAEVKDLLAYLKVLVSPQDSISMLRIINTPARGIGRTTTEQIEQYALTNDLSFWSALKEMLDRRMLPGRAETALSAFRRMIETLSENIESKPVHEVLAAILDSSGYRAMLEQEASEESRQRISNLEELLNAAADAAERGESLRDFLDHAALVSDADSADSKAQVSLLTMHNAKGLEFPVVFIAGMEEGLFPNSRSVESSASSNALEEERRLCYVGMTRAEKRLYLSWARFRRRFGGQPEQSIPSRFLKEVPPQLLKLVRGTDGSVRGGGVDLYAERHQVRETARKNLYTGKAYNSAENIRQFFVDRGMPVPSGLSPKPAAPQQQSTARPAAAVPQPPKKKKLGPGSTIEHAKYGRGTILRLEGSGEDTKLTVNFQGHGLKKLVAKYAGIKIE